ncbi:MAG: hypothetical protein DMF17_05345, partial [Verrucomicrobia bacterium]
LFAIPFDFGQLGHRADYAGDRGNQRWIGRSVARCQFGAEGALIINIEVAAATTAQSTSGWHACAAC